MIIFKYGCLVQYGWISQIWMDGLFRYSKLAYQIFKYVQMDGDGIYFINFQVIKHQTEMKEYHNGPIEDEKRSCTDLFCFIILVIFCIVMFIFGIVAWTGNNFSKLTTPYDSDGKGCGVDYPDYPFIYFVSPHVDTLWRTVCLKECPTGDETTLQCQTNSFVLSCNENNSADEEQAVEIYETTPIRNTICMATADKIQAQISSALGGDSLESRISALSATWPIILACIPIAIVLSFIFMFIMRYTAGIFVYLLLAIVLVALIGLGIYLLVPQQPAVAGIEVNKVGAMIGGVIALILAFLIIIAFCCFRKRIKLAATIVKVSSRFVEENCCISILPLILFVVMVIFLVLWILEALGYYSMGVPTHEPKTLPFQHFQTTGFVKALGFIHIFQLFWGIAFLVETGDFIVAGAATSWYFTREDPYSESQRRYRSFHIGSVAMGSFFMALFGFIRFMYELLTPESAKEEGCMSKWKSFCNCCCFLCVTYIFNCFNSGAYTFIHLAGDSYCSSAWAMVALKIKEPVSTAVVMFMSVLFSTLVRVGITATTLLVAYLILSNAEPYKSNAQDLTAPMVVIGVLAFAISSFFVSLYSEAMEAVYCCYLADKDAGGGEDKAPEELKDFLQEAKEDGHWVE